MSFSQLTQLNGKRALVTGAAAGIGHGCAIALAQAGANLVINDRPGSDALTRTTQEILDLGCDCTPIEADVFSSDGCETLVQQANELAGPIDILISNPAYGKRGELLDFPLQEFEQVLHATFTSGFQISQAVARQMVQRGTGGKILFISSVCGEIPFARNGPYGAAKAALNHFTQTLAVELFASRINVNAIEPGWIDTPNERKTFSDEMIESAGASLPWGRMGTPEDIGRAAVFLVSDAADYITGTVLPVDGGYRFKDVTAQSQHKTVDQTA